MHLDPGERRRLKAASHELDLLLPNAPASAVFDAIRPCVPVAAGLFSVIRPGADEGLVSQSVELPPDIFESWLRIPPDLLQRILAPVVLSGPGRLWRDRETLQGAQREELEVLRELDGAGLGEGAGYKLLERPIPWDGVEHIMLALLMARGERVPARAQVMLEALHTSIREAVLRIALPLRAGQPIHPQIVAEQSLGCLCLSPSGRVIVANRRAYQLVERYGDAAGIQGRRGAMVAFAVRAREKAGRGQPWQLGIDRPPAILQVDVHSFIKETGVFPEDTFLLYLREVLEPPVVADALPALGLLTNREWEVAFRLAHSEGPQKQIADRLGMSPGTLRTHAQKIHKKLGIQSRLQLILRLKGRRIA
jgi:DNA-binding CsgD family transcriptional regulator